MKTTLCTCLLLSLTAALPTQADILLGAPGVPVGTKIATQVPFKIDYQLANSYKFVLTGIQAKGDTLGAPGSSGTTGNGGQFHLQATVSDNNGTPKERVGSLYFRDVQDFNTAPLQTLLITPAAVFKADSYPITITTQWMGEGNAHKPNGVFTILGEYQKEPPRPVGTLSFKAGDYILVSPDAQTDGTATIIRE